MPPSFLSVTGRNEVPRTLDDHISELIRDLDLKAVDLERLHDLMAKRRTHEQSIPATGDIINNIGNYFPWEERDDLARELYNSQFLMRQKTVESQTSHLQEETAARDSAYEAFIGPRGSGKTTFAQMLPHMLVEIAEKKGGGRVSKEEKEFRKSILASFKNPKKLFFHLDFSQPANRPNKALKAALGEAALLGALLLHGALRAWYENAPLLEQICNWVLARPAFKERLRTEGVLAWCAKHFPEDKPESLHCLIVMDQVHVLDERAGERTVFNGLNSLFTATRFKARGIPYACWCLCTTTFDPYFTGNVRATKRKRSDEAVETALPAKRNRKKSDGSVQAAGKKLPGARGLFKSLEPTAVLPPRYKLLPKSNNLFSSGAPGRGGHMAIIHTIRPLSPEAVKRIVVTTFLRMGVLAQNAALPAVLETFFAGSGLGRDIAAGMAALANAKEIEKGEQAFLSNLTTLRVPMLKAFLDEKLTASSVQAAEDCWTSHITHPNGTLNADWLEWIEQEDRMKYLQAIIRTQLTDHKVSFFDPVFEGAAIPYGWFFMRGLFSLLATGQPSSLQEAEFKLSVPPKHLEIFAMQRMDQPDFPNVHIVSAGEDKEFYGEGPTRRRELVHAIMDAGHIRRSEQAKKVEQRKPVKLTQTVQKQAAQKPERKQKKTEKKVATGTERKAVRETHGNGQPKCVKDGKGGQGRLEAGR